MCLISWRYLKLYKEMVSQNKETFILLENTKSVISQIFLDATKLLNY